MDKDFIEKTINVWQPYCPEKKLSEKDALEIITNLSNFFDLLNEWNKKGVSKEEP